LKNFILIPFGVGNIFNRPPKILPAIELGAGSTGAFRVPASERSRPRPRVPRATEGAVDGSTHFDRWHHARVLARIRLTRTAAERGPVLFGACEPGRDLRRNVVFTPLVAQ
jgi:hypothetical protein